MCADIVIVGGGPVGLWTAIQMKKRRPGIDIQIYERYAVYERSHVLKLEHLSMLFYGKNSKDPLEKAFYEEVTGKSLAGVVAGAATGRSAFVGTNVLEGALKTYAQGLGVKVAYEKVEDPQELMRKHPECATFIAADGAKSKMRSILMGEDAVRYYTLQHVVELKYLANAEAGRLSAVDAYKTNKLLSSAAMAFEYVGKGKKLDKEANVGTADATRVTVRFFTTEDVYNQLPEASFRDPLTLGDARIPQGFAQDMQTYLNVRAARAREVFNAASVKLSKLTLMHYAAKKFALRQQGGQNWYFVGDAALGVPYFRSLNSGLIVGSQLAFILTRDWSNKAKALAYNFCRPLDIAWEFTEARLKNSALELYNAFRKVSAKSPLQVVKWRKREVEGFKKNIR